MSGCYDLNRLFCHCDCHKNVWFSTVPPICNCKCWNTAASMGSETLAVCIHGMPLKFGNCAICAEVHKNNLKQSVDMKEAENKAFANLDHLIEHCQDGIEKAFERIENINSALENHWQRYDVTINWIKERIEKIEENLKDIKIYSNPLQEKVWQENIIKRFEKLEKFHDEFKNVLKEDIEEYQEIHENIENRLTKLEKYKSLIDSLNSNRNDWVEPINRLFDEINKLEQSRDANSRSHKDIFDRIEKLESSKLTQELDPQVWVHIHERLDKLESKTMLMISVDEYLKKWKWVHEQISRFDMILHSSKNYCSYCGNKNG